MAASKARVKVKGVRELQRALSKVEADAADLKAGHTAVATVLLPGIGSRAPKRTGALSLSFTAGATKGRARLLSSVPYAGVIEYGHPKRNIEAARMVRDTIEAEQAEIVATYERELERIGQAAGFRTE